jgi:hypothetical protein
VVPAKILKPYPKTLKPCTDGAAWDLARTLLRPRNGLVCARPTAAAALGHRFLTRPLTWQTEETRAGSFKGRSKSAQKKAGSAKGSTKERHRAPSPAFSFALPFGAAKIETPEPEKRGRYRLPFFGRGQEESEAKVGSGASFDRRVKLKARVVASGTQSAVAWSAFLPLGRPRSTRAQVEVAATPSTDRLLGLKRLVGLNAPETVPLVVPTENEEFPHVAALAALLGQRQEAPGGSNRVEEDSSNGRTGELMEMGRASASGIARNAVPLALAGAVLGGSAWLVSSIGGRSFREFKSFKECSPQARGRGADGNS